MLSIRHDDVIQALPISEAIEAMHLAFVSLSSGEAVAPIRTYLDMSPHSGGALTMPVYIPSLNRMSVKIVSIHPENPKRNMPMIHAVVNLFDADTGELLAVIDGESLTAIRTGAASGLATRLLANPDADSLALFGAGVQGRWQIDAVLAVRQIKRIVLFDTDPKRIEQMKNYVKRSYQIEAETGNEKLLGQADVVCTATSALTPVFEHESLKTGVHINGIGSYRPDMREIPTETITNGRLFVDSTAACLAEAGDLLMPIEEGVFNEKSIAAEIGEVAGETKSGRLSHSDITVFKSVGNAVQDLAVATRIYDRAKDLGLGTQLSL